MSDSIHTSIRTCVVLFTAKNSINLIDLQGTKTMIIQAYMNIYNSSRVYDSCAKEENRLNEAAKIRVAKLLGMKRNMIDLTDDEPPRKQARVDSYGHVEARHAGPGSDPAPQSGVRGSVGHGALIQATNAYVNPSMGQLRGPRAQVPQPMQLAHPPDLLDHISLAVSSLETFQLREILSTAALRHPDVLELLRTSFRIQETHKSTAHQALYDLLLSQSQEEARIVRVQDERVRRDSVYTSRPHGPPPMPSGVLGSAAGNANPMEAIRPPWGPEYYNAQPANTSGQTPRVPSGQQQPPTTQPPAPALPSQVSDFHAAITRLSGPVWYMSDATKLDALRTLCNAAIEFAKNADISIKSHLRNDKVFTETCWRLYDTLDERSKTSLLQTRELSEAVEKLERVRDGCFVGFAEFLDVFRKNSIPVWKERVRGLGGEDEEDDADEGSLPDQYDSYDSMDEEEDEDDL
ncbi:hypothetical protein KCU93_g251, partial [Aureobasidium melanogenum]